MARIENVDNLLDAASDVIGDEPGAGRAITRRRMKTISAGFTACEVCGRPIKDFSKATKIINAWVGPECTKRLRELGHTWEGSEEPKKAAAPAGKPSPAPAKPAPSSELARRATEANLAELKRHVERNGVGGLQRLYKDARADLYDRLRKVKGPQDRATPTTLRAMVGQVEGVISTLGDNIEEHLADVGRTAAELGAAHAVDEYKALEENFRGTTPALSLDEAAIQSGLVDDVEPSLLRRYALVSKTWGLGAIHNIEKRLGVGTLAGKSPYEMSNDLMAENGLLDEERYRAERIVRTEMAYAHGAAKFQAMSQAADEVGEEKLQKRLIETFDDRTGDDSFLLHGQTVPVSEPFTWKHKVRGEWVVTEYMHPPNRPNDRAVVIPWDPTWEETEEEAPLTKGELRAASPTRYRAKVGVEIPPGHRPGKPYR